MSPTLFREAAELPVPLARAASFGGATGLLTLAFVEYARASHAPVCLLWAYAAVRFGQSRIGPAVVLAIAAVAIHGVGLVAQGGGVGLVFLAAAAAGLPLAYAARFLSTEPPRV